jgi:hypothetical protein
VEAAAFAGADVDDELDDDELEDDEPDEPDELEDDESDDVLVEAGFDESDPDFDPLSLLADPLEDDDVDVDELDDLLSLR